jgi:hypothetical protein
MFPSGLFVSHFQTTMFYESLIAPIRAELPAHLIFLDVTILDMSIFKYIKLYVKISRIGLSVLSHHFNRKMGSRVQSTPENLTIFEI